MKHELCKLFKHKLFDAEIVNCLSNGLYFPYQNAIMLSNPSSDLDAFITRTHDLGAIGGSILQQVTTENIGYPLPNVAAFTVSPATDSEVPSDKFGNVA